MNKILFTGYYGFNNMGDDSFVEVCDWGAKNLWKTTSYGFLPPTGRVKNSVNNLLKGQSFKGKYSVESALYGSQSDYVVFGGGSLFIREIPKFSAYDIFRLLSKLKATKMAAIGVSLGPFVNKKAQDEWKAFLSDFAYICVRDSTSYKISQEMGLQNTVQGYDLAAILPTVYANNPSPSKSTQSKRTIGISICLDDKSGLSSQNNNNRITRLTGVLKQLAKEHSDLVFQFYIVNVHPEHGDLQVTDDVIKALDLSAERINVIPYTNVKAMWDSIALCDVILSCRLHAGIFAAFSNTPFIQIEYHRKCADLLDDLGYPSQLRIGDMDLSISETAERISYILNEPSKFHLANKERCTEMALNNFTKFNML